MENGYSLSDLAAATGSGDFGGGNAWILIILFALIFGNGGGWFGNGNGAAQAASTADIQRAVDLSSIQSGQASISSDIQRGIYEINGATKDAAYNNLSEIRDVQAAVATGNANIINNLTSMAANQQTCCCTTQRAIDSVNYNLATQSAAIQANDTANTQRVLDAISQGKIESLQAQVQALQGQLNMAGVVRYPMASTYSSGTNPFCGSCGSF